MLSGFHNILDWAREILDFLHRPKWINDHYFGAFYSSQTRQTCMSRWALVFHFAKITYQSGLAVYQILIPKNDLGQPQMGCFWQQNQPGLCCIEHVKYRLLLQNGNGCSKNTTVIAVPTSYVSAIHTKLCMHSPAKDSTAAAALL